MKNVLLVAGEVSGDMHAAELVRAVREQQADVEFWGIGGDELKSAGMEILYHVRETAVLGLVEVLKHLSFFRRMFRHLVDELKRRKPDLLILVDYPGFNLRFATKAHELGYKLLYYISPQVWAWHRSRVYRMAKIIDRLLVIFPFEVEVFKGTGLRVDFVGHPLVDRVERFKHEPVAALPWPGDPRIALLPGSREQEVNRILPIMLKAAEQVMHRYPTAGFLVASPNARIAQLAEKWVRTLGLEPCRVVERQTMEVLRQARAAMVASGTATVEASLLGCPMIVVYRTAALTYFAGRLLVRVPHLGMVNLVAGRELCPEFIQYRAEPEAMAEALAPLVEETPQRSEMVQGLQEVATRLGSPGAAARAARIVLEELSLIEAADAPTR